MTRISRRRFAQGLLATVGLSHFPPSRAPALWDNKPSRRPSLTDIEGLLVGHYTLSQRPTGCTVITSASSFTAGVDVRGGAPGTRETDLLKPENSVEKVDAIVLAGGSAFGLDAASGVSKFLEEQGRGLDVEVAKVPIVCAAILFDLRLGDATIRPDAKAGYEAAKAASDAPVGEGNVGAGAGATVGKLLGGAYAMKAGLGSWSISMPYGLKVGALVAVNCAGDVLDPARGKILAGARKRDGSGFVSILEQLRKGYRPGVPFQENTVLAVVATNATLTKAECSKVSQMAQDGLARCINPSHTPWDGDTVFALATSRWNGGGGVGVIGALAADVLATAIVRAVEQAESWGPYPAAKDYPSKKR